MRRLISDGSAADSGNDGGAAAAGDGGERLFLSLSRWLGADGCRALFSRARADSLNTHPAVGTLTLRAREQPHIAGIAESVAKHGDRATANGIQAMLAATIELLGRLIGREMAARLIERSVVETPRDDAGLPERNQG